MDFGWIVAIKSAREIWCCVLESMARRLRSLSGSFEGEERNQEDLLELPMTGLSVRQLQKSRGEVLARLGNLMSNGPSLFRTHVYSRPNGQY